MITTGRKKKNGMTEKWMGKGAVRTCEFDLGGYLV
jgi:hypothetical protein